MAESIDRMVDGVRRFFGEWGPMVAFLILAIAGGFAIQRASQSDTELLREGLVQSCERANVRDLNANQRTAVMEEVLEAAADSREKEAAISDKPEDAAVKLQVAARYRELAQALPYVEPVDCQNAIPRP